VKVQSESSETKWYGTTSGTSSSEKPLNAFSVRNMLRGRQGF